MKARRIRCGSRKRDTSIPSRALLLNPVALRNRAWLAILVVSTSLLVWLGCSIEKNYKLLNFFFDGVPDPRVVAAGADSVRIAKETGGVYYIHEPYAQQRCTDCHTDAATGQILPEVAPTVCLKCHAAVQTEHRFTHGPVAANACTWCHAPHESTVQPLMRTTAPQVCQQCHGPALMGNPKSPVHSDLSRNCLECHMGHGGDARFFLTPSWSAQPQRDPSEVPR